MRVFTTLPSLFARRIGNSHKCEGTFLRTTKVPPRKRQRQVSWVTFKLGAELQRLNFPRNIPSGSLDYLVGAEGRRLTT